MWKKKRDDASKKKTDDASKKKRDGTERRRDDGKKKRKDNGAKRKKDSFRKRKPKGESSFKKLKMKQKLPGWKLDCGKVSAMIWDMTDGMILKASNSELKKSGPEIAIRRPQKITVSSWQTQHVMWSLVQQDGLKNRRLAR